MVPGVLLMPIRRSIRSLLRVAFALIAVGTLHTAVAASASLPPPVQLLSSAIVGRPSVAKRAIIWSELRGEHVAILGYNLATGTQFAVAERTGTVLALAADDTLVVWIERDLTHSRLAIFGADLQ